MMKEIFYNSVIGNTRFGYVCHEIIYGRNGLPADYRIIDFNKTFGAIAGLKSESLTGMRVSELSADKKNVPTDLNDFYRKLSLEAGSEGFEFFAESSKHWYNVLFVRNNDGYLVTLLEDITQLKSLQAKLENNGYLTGANESLVQMSKSLSESEDKFRLLAEQLPVGVYRTTIEGKLIYANMALAKILNYESVDELLTVDVMQLYVNPDARHDQLDFAENTSAVLQSEFQLKRKTGEMIWVRDNCRLLFDKDNHPVYFDGILEDITEKKQAEIAIKESKANLVAILENTLESIWSVDLNYEIKYVNEVFASAFKQTFGKQISPGVNIINTLPESMSNMWKERYDKAFQNNHFLFEDRIDINGTSIYIEVAMNPIVIDGKVAGVSVYGKNVTEKKLSEQKLIVAKEKAEESDRLKSAFLANLSHEIRTPMSGIIGFLNLLNEPDLSEENKSDYINIVTQSGQRLLDTINDIIEISKIESGELRVNMSSVNAFDLMGFFSNCFSQQITQKGLKYLISNRLPANIRFFRSDRKKLESIILNLLKNAVKFTTSGSIELGCHLEADKVVFYVKDTGTGIPEDQLGLIFERFVQVDITTARPHEGSGLGLAIVKAYVEMLQGTIKVESNFGTGTTFTFSLPYIEDNGPKTIKEQYSGMDNSVKGCSKILIAEDDYASYLYLQKAISLEGATFLHTVNGEDTVESVRSNPDLSLLLLDIKMPGMTGLEAARKIREFNKTIPIIAQTAYSLSGDRELAIEAGCNDYISKPINRKELQNLIEKYIGKGS